MAYKLKLDESGKVVVNNGKPVYLKEDGSEIEFDMNEAFNKIHTLNEENKSRREKLSELESKLKEFGDLDPKKAQEYKALAEKLKNKKMVDDGEIEKLKAEIAQSYEAKATELQKQYEAKIQGLESNLSDKTNLLHNNILNNHFLNSKFVQEKIAIPADMLMSKFSQNFAIDEHGAIYAKDSSGNPVLSEEKLGTRADFDEALKMLVNKYPHKNDILKPSGTPGSGFGGSPNGTIIPGGAIDPKLPPTQRLALARKLQQAQK